MRLLYPRPRREVGREPGDAGVIGIRYVRKDERNVELDLFGHEISSAGIAMAFPHPTGGSLAGPAPAGSTVRPSGPAPRRRP